MEPSTEVANLYDAVQVLVGSACPQAISEPSGAFTSMSISILRPSNKAAPVESGFSHVSPIKYYPTVSAVVSVAVFTQKKFSLLSVHKFAFLLCKYKGTAGVLTTMLILI